MTKVDLPAVKTKLAGHHRRRNGVRRCCPRKAGLPFSPSPQVWAATDDGTLLMVALSSPGWDRRPERRLADVRFLPARRSGRNQTREPCNAHRNGITQALLRHGSRFVKFGGDKVKPALTGSIEAESSSELPEPGVC